MRIISIAAILLAAASSYAGEVWPQFRGPGGDGDAGSANVPLMWSEKENVIWKTPIHGKGWSSPVICDDQIWMTTATEDGRRQYAICVSLSSGEVLHDVLLVENENPDYCHPTNSYASPTPVVEQGRVYVHFGKYGTACLDTSTGTVLWKRTDFHCNHWRGPGSSPVISGNVLFVAYDGYDVQYVTALNKHTGETLWRRDRNIDYGSDNGDRMKAYSTAAVSPYEGGRQFISPSAGATISYDAESGRELWRVRHGGMNAGARPVLRNDLAYITGGDKPLSLIAVRPDGKGDVTDSHIDWSLNKGVPKRSSLVVVGELLFMISDDGVASCVDALTGKPIWQKRLGGTYWASPLHANGRIYYFDKDGKTPVVAADRKFQELAENHLDAGFLASPAVSNDALVLRTTTHLYRIEP